MTPQDIAGVIGANKGAVLFLDNDHWSLRRRADTPQPSEDEVGVEAAQEWHEAQIIIRVHQRPECDLLEALALLAGLEVEQA